MHFRKHISKEFLHTPFKDLQKIIESTGRKLKVHEIDNNHSKPLLRKATHGELSGQKQNAPLSDEDIFRDAMKEVREIKEFRIIPLYQKKPVPVRKNSSPDNEALNALGEIV